LRPSRASVEALVKKIPRGKVATIPLLREVLAKQHKADVACPFLTRRALLAIASGSKPVAPFWRVVAATGDMIAGYPGGATRQAGKLKREGVVVATTAAKRKVADLAGHMIAIERVRPSSPK